MMNLSARLDRIEALTAYRPSVAGPVFIEPRDCTDREAFAQACRAAAGDAASIIILPENGREAPATTGATS